MKLVADANILFSLVRHNSATSNLFNLYKIELFSPSFVIEELSKYKSEIEEKSKKPFKQIEEELKQKISLINEEKNKEYFKKFDEFVDKKDVPYLALAEYLNLPIWSNDAHLKSQTKIKVYTTLDLIHILT